MTAFDDWETAREIAAAIDRTLHFDRIGSPVWIDCEPLTGPICEDD